MVAARTSPTRSALTSNSEPAGDGAAYEWHESDFVRLEPEVLVAGVIRTPFLSREGCARLLEEIDLRARQEAGRAAANSMHDHGVELGAIGLDSVVTDWMEERLRDLLVEHFEPFEAATLDHHHSYLVQYGRELDEDLGFHVDDSEVTLNLCLGEDFSGAELVMLGARCDRHRQTPIEPAEALEIHHEPGSLVIHSGCHRHRVDPIRRGVRRNVIGWLRSSKSRERASLEPGQLPGASACAPWCGAYPG